nr:uncharacterized protein LOC124815974 [Hydra vulgaris]
MAEVEDEEIHRAALEGRPTSVVRMSLLEGHDRRLRLDKLLVLYSMGQLLAFIRNNQNKLRSEQYDAMHEHVVIRANDFNVRPALLYCLLHISVAEEYDYAKRGTPINVDSLAINKEVLDRLPGDVKVYLSTNTIETDDLNKINNFPVEFLNSLTPSGMPVHCLKLKIGTVIMLLRNLDLKAGLCNGTRLMVRALKNNYIDRQVLTGVSDGKRVFVPRVQLTQSDSNLLFTLKHHQFPVRL